MNRDGNDWTSSADTMLIQPDFQSSCFPVHSSKRPTLIRRRKVRFATNLTVEATIPTNYWEPMERAKPVKLTLAELRERVETFTREVVQERQAVAQQQEILHQFRKEHDALQQTREHIAIVKRQAIHDLQLECSKLEENIMKMKADLVACRQRPGQQLKRRHSQRELYSDACYKARVPGIWSTGSSSSRRSRMRRMNSLEILCS